MTTRIRSQRFLLVILGLAGIATLSASLYSMRDRFQLEWRFRKLVELLDAQAARKGELVLVGGEKKYKTFAHGAFAFSENEYPFLTEKAISGAAEERVTALLIYASIFGNVADRRDGVFAKLSRRKREWIRSCSTRTGLERRLLESFRDLDFEVGTVKLDEIPP